MLWSKVSVPVTRCFKGEECVPLLVLDLGLDVVDGIGRLHLEGDSLSSEGLDKDLHATREVSERARREFRGGEAHVV